MFGPRGFGATVCGRAEALLTRDRVVIDFLLSCVAMPEVLASELAGRYHPQMVVSP
ncbi:MAG: hypothetical protein ABI327_13305 [Burkholderiaceae bacterium]